MIRNPFNAIVSTYRHIRFGVHSNSDILTRINIVSALRLKKDETKKININDFETFAIKHIMIWRNIIEDWIKLGEVLVVHFEDVVEDKVSEVERILGFLNIPLDTRRIECMKYANLDFYRRNSPKLQQNLFSEKLSNLFKNNVERVNDLLHKFGHRKIPYNKYLLINAL